MLYEKRLETQEKEIQGLPKTKNLRLEKVKKSI